MQDLSCVLISSVQLSSVSQWCPTLCNPMNRSMPGLPVHHQLPEFTQTHVHRVRDAIQPSHLLSSPSPPAPDPYTYHKVLKFFVSCDKIFFFLKLNFIVVYTTFSSSIYQMDREAWHAVIHGVAKSRTRLSD